MQLNRIVDTGYAGIILGSDGMTVNRNILVRTMSTLNDGAAIYTNCNGSIVTENIVLDVVGDLSTSHPWYPLGHGIWPEFLSEFENNVITDNTIVGCNGHGLFLQNLFTSTMSRNVIADCRSSAIDLGVRHDNLSPQGHLLHDNTLAVAVPTQRVPRTERLTIWWLHPYSAPLSNLVRHYGSVDYGTMSQTAAVVPTTGSDRFVRQTPTGSWSSLAAWAGDNASWAQASGTLREGRPHVLVNDTLASAAIPVPAGTWTRTDGSAVSGTVTVPSFRSVLIVTTGAVPARPWTMASGINWRAATPTTAVLPGVDDGPSDHGLGTGDGGSIGGGGAGGGGGGCGAGGLGGMGIALLLIGAARLRGTRWPRQAHD